MLSERQQAVTSAEATAQNYNRLSKSYQDCAPKSSGNLKEKIGELLLYLQDPLSQHQRQKCWTLFDLMLRCYLDIKFCGGRYE